ncbi:universal stress protein [Prosthecobacter sp.]|uniref:universal stress protein n=1 Tax=Prosthecobacter sp. TaxID=1965333 RepID=UPI00378502CC
MSILCATDFSPSARGAADVAVLLAKKLKLPLHLVYCGVDYIVMGDLPLLLPDDRPDIERLHAEAERLRESGVEVTEDLRHGSAIAELLAAAKELPTELIVLGFAGRSSGRSLLGSIAENVAENAPFPTLVVRQPDVLLSWLRDTATLDLLFGVDLAGTSDAAITWMGKLAGIGRIKAGVAHIESLPDKGTTLEEHRAHERDVWDKVHAALPELSLTVHTREVSGHPTEHFLDLVRENGAGLVVIGSRQRHGLKRLSSVSFSRRVLAYAGTNVLCVPMHAAVATAIPVIHRVLAAVDLEGQDWEVLRHAHSLLAGEGEIRLVHVCLEPTSGINPVIASKVYFDHSLAAAAQREEAEKTLKALPASLLHAGNVRITSEVLTHHDVAAAICTAAEKFGADAICMGARRRSRIATALLGSAVQSVLSHTHIPVFITAPPLS